MSRYNWLDIAKGITIILMVFGHTSIPLSVSNFIWSFHMPLFFISSGWSTNWEKYSIKIFIKKKVKSLLIPFIIYSIIVFFLQYHLNNIRISEILLMGWQGYALWFIPVLFISLIISKFLLSIKYSLFKILCTCSLVLIGAYLNNNQIQLPWTLSSVPYATFLIIVGSYVKRYGKIVCTPNLYIMIIGTLIPFIISNFYRLDMAWNAISPVMILTVGAISGTFMVYIFSSFIDHYTKYISKVLMIIGRETFLILSFSQIIIIYLNHYFTLHTLVKYIVLILILVFLKYIKDFINSFLGHKILG